MPMDDACPLKEIPIENKDCLRHLNAPGTYLPPAIRAPVSELFSVGVCHNSKYFQQRDTLEIYGIITLYDEHYNTYELYRRCGDDPQTLTPQHNLLSLDMLADCLVYTSWSLIFLCLMDKANDSVIVREGLSFDKLNDINQHNQVRQLDYKSVFVTYFTVDVRIMAGDDVCDLKENPIKNKGWSRDPKKPGSYLPQTISAPASELFSVAGDDVRTPKEIPIKNKKSGSYLPQTIGAPPKEIQIKNKWRSPDLNNKPGSYLPHTIGAPASSELFPVSGDDVRTPKEILVKNEKWLDYLKKEPYIPDIVAAPSSELFYVAVNPEYFGERDMCDIYGTITIYDEDNTSYELYCRDSDDPQTLTPQHNFLSLDMPAECLVSTSWSHMSLCLKDKTDDSLIVKKDLYFDKLTDMNQYNKVRQLYYNPVCVTYTAFPAAVVAILEITLIKTNDSALVPLNLSGKIITRCGNTYGHKYPGIVLFNTSPNRPIEALSYDPIELGRDVVVVPAYSFLRIHLQLSQHYPHQEEDIDSCVDFFAKQQYDEDRDIVAQGFVVRFNVQWFHPYELKPETRQPFREQFSSMPYYSLMEVYTVMIHHDINSELKISGEIGIRDGLSRLSLFDRNELNPVKFSGNDETIYIDVKSRCIFMSDCMSMGLEFKDVEGQVFIRGVINWSDYRVEKPMSWYDKNICSIIRGVHGYAAVFYTIFSKAVQAKVRILFKCNGYPYVSHRLCGSVDARHSNGKYLTEHDKAYYQSVLFRGNSSDIKSGCTLPLLKSVVAVPIDAVLKVAVDLYASPLSLGLPQVHLEKDVSFNLGSKIPQIIECDNCSIEVSVQWSNLDQLFSEE